MANKTGGKRMEQLDLPFAETNFGKSYSKNKKEEICRSVADLLSDYTSKKILLPSEDIEKLRNMKKRGLMITSKNIFSLLSTDLTDDEIKRLLEFQRSGIVPKTREEIFQLSSSVSESEKNNAVEKEQFYDFLRKNNYDWVLSNIDYLLTIYPWWKIKGLCFYGKICGYDVSSMDDVLYYLGSDESKAHANEKDILLCSEITRDQWESIESVLRLFSFDIHKDKDNKEFFLRLIKSSSLDQETLSDIYDYINDINEKGSGSKKSMGEVACRSTIRIFSNDYLGLLSLTSKQWEIVDQVLELFDSEGVTYSVGPSSLLKLASLSEDDVKVLKYYKSLGLEIDWEICSSLDKLNENKVKAIVKLWKDFPIKSLFLEDWVCIHNLVLKIIESDDFCEFIRGLGRSYVDRWFILKILPGLLDKNVNGSDIRRLYYYYKINCYYFSDGEDDPVDWDVDELLNEYRTNSLRPESIEFIYKKGLYQKEEDLEAFDCINKIPLRVLDFLQNNMKSVYTEDLNNLADILNGSECSFMHKYNYRNDINLVMDIIEKYFKKGKMTMNTIIMLFKFVCKYDSNSPINPDAMEFIYKKGLYENIENLGLFYRINEIPSKVREFLGNTIKSIDEGDLNILVDVLKDFKCKTTIYYENDVNLVVDIMEKYFKKGEMTIDTMTMLFKFVCKNVDNVSRLSRRMESGELTKNDLLKACDIIYPRDDKIEDLWIMYNKKHLPLHKYRPYDDDELPF